LFYPVTQGWYLAWALTSVCLYSLLIHLALQSTNHLHTLAQGVSQIVKPTWKLLRMLKCCGWFKSAPGGSSFNNISCDAGCSSPWQPDSSQVVTVISRRCVPEVSAILHIQKTKSFFIFFFTIFNKIYYKNTVQIFVWTLLLMCCHFKEKVKIILLQEDWIQETWRKKTVIVVIKIASTILTTYKRLDYFFKHPKNLQKKILFLIDIL